MKRNPKFEVSLQDRLTSSRVEKIKRTAVINKKKRYRVYPYGKLGDTFPQTMRYPTGVYIIYIVKEPFYEIKWFNDNELTTELLRGTCVEPATDTDVYF